MIVHVGVVLLAVGLAASESYKSDRTVQLVVGESAIIEGHEFTYVEPGLEVTDRQVRIFAQIQIDGGDIYAPATTSFRQNGVRPVPTPSVRSGISKDIYLVLDEVPDPEDDAIRLRVIIRPMVAWMWGGGALMAFGTLLALFPGGRRRGTEPVSALVGEQPPSATISSGPVIGPAVIVDDLSSAPSSPTEPPPAPVETAAPTNA